MLNRFWHPAAPFNVAFRAAQERIVKLRKILPRSRSRCDCMTCLRNGLATLGLAHGAIPDAKWPVRAGIMGGGEELLRNLGKTEL